MTPARLLLFPWWVVALATGAKAFSGNPVIGSRRLNRRGLHAARVRLANRIATRRRHRLAPSADSADVEAFDRDGFVVIRDFLPPERFNALQRQALGYAGAARDMRQGDTVTRRHAIDGAALRAIPELAALLAEPRWRSLLNYVWSFDAEPVGYIQSIHANVVAAEADPQTALHADTFHATVKAWLFLSDVAEDDGPFVYVPGSHRKDEARLAWERRRSIEAAAGGLDHLSRRGSFRIAAEELPSLGLPPPRTFAVPANTLVVADTSGFHARARATRTSVRTEVWMYGRRNPFLPWTGWSLSSLPGIATRQAGLMWRTRDLLRGVLGQPWRAVGRVTPTQAVPWE